MEDQGKLKGPLIHATAGAISGAVSRTVTSPLDVIKIRFQVQLEPILQRALLHQNAKGPSKYTGMPQATKDISRGEGLRIKGTAKGSKIWSWSKASFSQKYVSCSQANFACRGLGRSL